MRRVRRSPPLRHRPVLVNDPPVTCRFASSEASRPAICRRRARRRLTAILVTLAIAAASGCAASTGPRLETPHEGASWSPTVVLVSLDGFRWDYIDRVLTPALDRLAADGVRAEGLIPVFPTKTFPNHYSLVTGLHPGSHGIVANSIHDTRRDAWFSLSNRDAVGDAAWWGGEPIWVGLERAGRPTAPLFWPGSEAPIGGLRPRYWQPYDGTLSNEARGDRLLAWLGLPPGERPVFLTLYMSDVDDAGHRFGPDSAEVAAAVARVDAALGHFVDGLERRGWLERVNIVVVSDHGMAATPRERAILLDDYVDLDAVSVVDWTPVLSLRSTTGHDEELYAALKDRHPHLAVYRDRDLPERFHLRPGPRVTPVVGLADEGWTVTTRARATDSTRRWGEGNHGFDNALDSMRGIFIASGPVFRPGARVGLVEAIDVYALLAGVLGVTPAPHEGSLERIAVVRRDAR
jgi:predicted AlkP superfamily pyrophosphatase or phosphodiesterase